nr:hypothetical protein [Paenibacillus kribbensis]
MLKRRGPWRFLRESIHQITAMRFQALKAMLLAKQGKWQHGGADGKDG